MASNAASSRSNACLKYDKRMRFNENFIFFQGKLTGRKFQITRTKKTSFEITYNPDLRGSPLIQL